MKRKIVLIVTTGILLLIVAAIVLKPNGETDFSDDSVFSGTKMAKAEPEEAHDMWRRDIQKRENVELTGADSHDVAVGENVTLDCHLEPQDDLKPPSLVEWKFNDKDHVLVYKARGFADHEQADQFRDRAIPDVSWDLTRGKLAVKILSVTKADAGEYSCSVGHGSNRKQFSTQLRIKETAHTGNLHNRAQDQTTPNNSQKSAADALVLLVLAASTSLFSLCY